MKMHYLNKSLFVINLNPFKIVFILLYFISIIKIINLAEIKLTIRGEGNQQILDVNSGEFNILPSQIYINDVLQDYTGTYANNLVGEINYITLKWNEDIEIYSTHRMFYNLINIISIDIIDFIMPNLGDTRNMFEGCSNLVSINFYKIDT